ncbi:MAG TPA: AAA family ATPase [Nitrospirae bacterium]|nr:AAA family ATPase [Nitrospirota bacterium]
MPEAYKKNIELNPEFLQALRIIEETDRHIFITGRAGTGKSTLLQYFRDNTCKNVAVLASTGVAAVNIQGQTIHSFFKFRPNITPDRAKRTRVGNKEVYKNLEAVVIDEISMVRADLLDCMDVFLRRFGKKNKRPFGGIQMIFIGDLYQLPPVVTSGEKELFREYYESPFFFDSKVFRDNFWPERSLIASSEMEFIELQKVYRQKDEEFLGLLNAIRNNTASEEDMEKINRRCYPDFKENPEDFYVYLTTTNKLADRINQEKLDNLKGKQYQYEGLLKGGFEIKALPTLPELCLKKGAQVMLLNNDSLGRWINGSVGKIVDFESVMDSPDIIRIELHDGGVVDVVPFKWEMFEFRYDRDDKRIISESTGSFAQYPIKLAWAVTIHKSQGMTFDDVIVDIGRGTFSHGQLYVALSRCTTLKGIVLKKPVGRHNILMDRRVVSFVTGYQYSRAGEKQPIGERHALVRKAINGQKNLEILYLKAKDVKSRRVVIPKYAGELEYRGRKFPGLKAFCIQSKAERVFNMERILEMKIVD